MSRRKNLACARPLVSVLMSVLAAVGGFAITGRAEPRAGDAPASADVRRTGPISVDAGFLSAARAGDRVSIRLFDDVEFTLDVTGVSRRPTGVCWHGRIVGEPLGTATVTVENGIVSAGFWSRRGSYGIVPSAAPAAGFHVAEWRTPESTRRCLMAEGAPSICPTRPPVPGGRPTPPHAAGSRGPAGGSSLTPRSCDCPDDQALVDVLCVYTTLAKNAAGGLAPLQARVQNAVDAANGAYINSQVHTSGANRLQVRLVGYAEVSYNESSPDWLDHLIRVTEPADGFMDNVHALRDQFKADTVLLVVDDPRFTGGAAWWAIWDEGQAFSCCNWRGLGGGSLLLAHELGHNFGCAHDHENDAQAPVSYAWGHYFSEGPTTYRTIMSYPGTVDLQYFSNPSLTHPDTGQPLGVGAGDPRAAYNAFVHQQTRWVLANYRDAPGIIDCNGNGIDDAIDLATGSSSDANGDCRPDECDERRYADAQTPGPGEGRAWANAGADLRELLDLAYLKCSNIKEIWVADGIYTPARWPGDRFGSFRLTSGLAMHGGFQGKSRIGGGETSLAQRIAGSHASILSGEIDGPGRDDNSYSVVTAYAADEHSLVDRFTIQHGYSDWYGAGVYLEGSSTRFTDCLFQENRAGSGGALAAWWGGSPSLHRCALMDNTAVGGGGGGLSFNAGVHLTVEQSEFRGNHAWWGGALAAGDSSAEIRASVFSGNAADVYNGGAIDLYNTQAVIAGCLITKNHAVGDAGGIWSASGTTASIINCTLADNTTDEYTGGLVVFFAAADVVNSILWGHNGSYQDEQSRNLLYFAATGGVNYSRVAGWAGDLGGLANSGEDPYFADPSAGDYSLSYGSSCIDAGDSSALPAGLVVDAAGNPRRADDHSMPDTGPGDPPVVDLGALERVPCKADFDGSGFVDLDDYIAFVFAFEEGVDEADFDGTGFVDTDDFTAFVLAFEQGC